MISLIAAISEQTRAIGKDNGLIWKIPTDMARFKQLTTGHPVIMGRRTWESLPERFRPLPNRANIVITRDDAYQATGALVAHSIEEALAQAKESEGGDEIYVIGGGEIYVLALPYADRLDLTLVDDRVDGDAHFPSYDAFTLTQESEPLTENGVSFRFVTLKR
jgi:dihydrofolate reductase